MIQYPFLSPRAQLRQLESQEWQRQYSNWRVTVLILRSKVKKSLFELALELDGCIYCPPVKSPRVLNDRSELGGYGIGVADF